MRASHRWRKFASWRNWQKASRSHQNMRPRCSELPVTRSMRCLPPSTRRAASSTIRTSSSGWPSPSDPPDTAFGSTATTLYAWCSLDTILLPGLLEAEGVVESTDPVSGETIRLTVTADQIVEVQPPDAVTSIFVPGKNPTKTDDDELVVGADSEVCTSMLFYASRENAEKALENYPNIAIFTIEEAFTLARETWTEPTRALRRQAAAN